MIHIAVLSVYTDDLSDEFPVHSSKVIEKSFGLNYFVLRIVDNLKGPMTLELTYISITFCRLIVLVDRILNPPQEVTSSSEDFASTTMMEDKDTVMLQ